MHGAQGLIRCTEGEQPDVKRFRRMMIFRTKWKKTNEFCPFLNEVADRVKDANSKELMMCGCSMLVTRFRTL